MINTTEMKILNFMKSRLDEDLSIRKLSENIGVSYQPTHKHVNDLKKIGVVELRKKGNSVFCRLKNTEAASLLLALSSLYEKSKFMEDKVIASKIVQELIDKLKEKIFSLVLFGSYAKGKEKKDSDIDLLCISSFNAKKEIDKQASYLGMKYGKDLNIILSDPIQFKSMLLSDKQMVGKEALQGIVLFGFECFWRNVLEAKAKKG